MTQRITTTTDGDMTTVTLADGTAVGTVRQAGKVSHCVTAGGAYVGPELNADEAKMVVFRAWERWEKDAIGEPDSLWALARTLHRHARHTDPASTQQRWPCTCNTAARFIISSDWYQRVTAGLDKSAHTNPVLTEARIRGDFEDFARQLRRGTSDRWDFGDVEAAIPVIDRWAHSGPEPETEEKTMIECPHWSPGRITLRKGCTSCAASAKEATDG